MYKINQMTQRWSGGGFFSSDLFDLLWKRPTWQGITKNWPLVEVKALRKEHELFLPLLEKVACSGHLGFAGVLADAGKVHLLFLHVVTQPNVVEVRRDVDQSVWHNRILVLRQHFVYKELKPIHKIGENNQSAARTYIVECCEREKKSTNVRRQFRVKVHAGLYRASWSMKLAEENIWKTWGSWTKTWQMEPVFGMFFMTIWAKKHTKKTKELTP